MGDVIDFGPGGKSKLSDRDGKPLIEREIAPEDSEIRNTNAARSALALKIAGASYDDIARTLDYASPAQARIAVERMLSAAVPDDVDYRGLRQLANARLDSLLRAVAPRALSTKDADQLAYARMMLSVVDRQIKLNGLDAPQVHLINPQGDDLAAYVNAMAELMGAEQVEEGDIFALEEGPTGVWGSEDDDQ